MTPSDSSSTFIARHWYGRNDWFVTLLFTLLLLRLLLGVLQNVVPDSAVIPWLVLSGGIMIWQVVGAFRAGDKALKTQGSGSLHWCLYGMIPVVFILTVMQGADLLTALNKYQDAGNSAVNITPSLLPVSEDLTQVTLTGELSWALRQAFLDTLDAHSSITTVALNSDGGLVFVGRAIALTITERGLSTQVVDRCYSACTISFMAGKNRLVTKSAKLGFHRYRLATQGVPGQISIAEELAVDRNNFAMKGVSHEFLDQLFSAEHSEIWIPDQQTLLRTGVVTQLIAER